MDAWLVDGEPAGVVPVTDRGLAYGDGLFETIAWRSGGPRFFDWHLQRLAEGCRTLGLSCPEERTLLAEMSLAAGGCAEGSVKLIVTRGSGPRGYAPPPTTRQRRLVGFFPQSATLDMVGAAGVALRICHMPISVNPALAGLKTLSRLDQVLARSEWQDPGIAEGLMLDHEGRIVCGTMSNIFLVRDGRLLTPDLALCGVRGIMRRAVICAARQLGIDVTEGKLTRHDIAVAEEFFVTNALIGIWPVRRCEQQVMETGIVTSALRRALHAQGVTECAP